MERNLTESELNRLIARRVRKAREDRTVYPMSQKEVGELIGLSDVGYGHYERGTHALSVWQLWRLADVLGRSVQEFLGLSEGLADDEVRILSMYRYAKKHKQDKTVLRLLTAVTEREEEKDK